MEGKVLLGFLLLLLPFGIIGASHGKGDDDHSAHWGYEEHDGPEDYWLKHYKKCGGSRQSPINIVTKEVDLNDELDDFEFDNYDDDFEDAKIINNGHTIEVAPGEKDLPRMFDEGGLDDKYQFMQLHFHWGNEDKQGSEHLIDGRAFPLEMHLVHMNKNYPNISVAKQKEDGIAVLAVLFKIDADDDNPALEPIIDKLDEVRNEGSKASVDKFNLESLLPENTMPYYRYRGSLTTPTCDESVIWTVFKEFVPIGKNQLQQFRLSKENDPKEPSEPLVNNFRPPQPLNGRIVELSGKANSGSVLGPSVMTAVFTALSFFL